MELIVLSIHLLVCICLIGLVLLQRSEGGALGMGGGGGGGLVSGRGAADALARMTSVAGGFFLVTSLGLTLLSGAANSSEGRSVLDLIPAQSAPATTPAPPVTTVPTPTPDPTEGRAPSNSQLVSLGPREATAATTAPVPSAATTRAGPIDQRQTAAATQPRQTPASTTTQPRTTPATTPPQRSAAAMTQPAATQTTPARTPPAPATTPNGAVNGIDLTTDTQTEPESNEAGVTAVRRERAGPDQ